MESEDDLEVSETNVQEAPPAVARRSAARVVIGENCISHELAPPKPV